MRWVLAIGAGSLAVHLLLLFALPGPSPSPSHGTVHPPGAIELTVLEAVEPAVPLVARSADRARRTAGGLGRSIIGPEAPTAVERVVADLPSRAAIHRVHHPVDEQDAIGPVVAQLPAAVEQLVGVPPSPSTAPLPGAPPNARRRAVAERLPDLSPRAVALSMQPMQRVAAGPSGGRVSQTERDRGDVAGRRSAELAAYLAAAAAPKFQRRRGPPDMRTDPDGTCHFDGETIDATIWPDGGVEFRARSIRAVSSLGNPEPPMVPLTPDEAEAPEQLAASISVAGTGWRAERSWFLTQTRGLRERLADAARDQQLRRAKGALQLALDRIWCDTALAPIDRRRAIFGLWDGTSSDEVGQRARALAIDFVRLNLPKGSDHAYSPVELAELNASREQVEVFAPYDVAPSAPLEDAR